MLKVSQDLGRQSVLALHLHLRVNRVMHCIRQERKRAMTTGEALENWPPPTEAARGAGAVAPATKWWGSLRGHTLYLARSSGLEKAYLVPVVEVDVTECK